MALTAHDPSRTRIDLHLHSDASGAATNWWVKGLGFGGATRESYTPPAEAHRKARSAGMDFVTLTDHESVDGVALLAGHTDVLTGVEVCAIFPEGGSTVDILVYGLDADRLLLNPGSNRLKGLLGARLRARLTSRLGASLPAFVDRQGMSTDVLLK